MEQLSVATISRTTPPQRLQLAVASRILPLVAASAPLDFVSTPVESIELDSRPEARPGLGILFRVSQRLVTKKPQNGGFPPDDRQVRAVWLGISPALPVWIEKVTVGSVDRLDRAMPDSQTG